jgi:hypothetical protein
MSFKVDVFRCGQSEKLVRVKRKIRLQIMSNDYFYSIESNERIICVQQRTTASHVTGDDCIVALVTTSYQTSDELGGSIIT